MVTIPWPSGWPHGCPRCQDRPATTCAVCEGTGTPVRVRAIVKALNAFAPEPNTYDGSEPVIKRLYDMLDDTATQGLIDALAECLTACACCMRVIAEIDAGSKVGRFENRSDALVREMRAEGIKDGFGQRARDAIARAEATK